MRTILVPIDFTSTTENAVKVASQWAKQYQYEHIILLKTSDESEFDYLHIAEGHSFVNEESINSLLEKFPDLKVSKAVSNWTLTRSINDIVTEQPSIELIVLGSDDQVTSSGSVVSENIISIARTSPVKTLIVPNSYNYSDITNILIPCDINGITKLERLFNHKYIIHQQDVQLMFLNINTKEDHTIIDEKKNEIQEYIHQNLTEIPSTIYYSYDKNIVDGILTFASTNKTDLIIALPGKHSFLYYLTSNSISEGIYQNVNQPVLILK